MFIEQDTDWFIYWSSEYKKFNLSNNIKAWTVKEVNNSGNDVIKFYTYY